MSVRDVLAPRRPIFLEELSKLRAFFRRDLLVLWSYRMAFFGDWFALILQIVTFYLVGKLVDPARMPAAGGDAPTYIQFVTVGIAFTSFVQVATVRLGAAIRNEQLMGTLESVLVTPTSPTTFQLGSVIYDLAYVPVRTTIFLVLVSVLLDVQLTFGGLLPALGVLVVFIPVVWGAGMVAAAGTLTFRRGALTTFAVVALTLPSTTYFPAEVVPSWAQRIIELNPLTIALQAARQALLDGGGWADVGPTIAQLAPIAAASLALGFFAFKLALRRERRQGTLGLY